MADENIAVEVSTRAAQAELERLRTENAALKRDLQYARDGLTKGRTRMREDNERLRAEVERLRAENERLAREAHAWWTALAGATVEIEQWRRTAERCVTAWTVVRGGVWDPNGLMDEHVDALRKALRPNVPVTGGRP